MSFYSNDPASYNVEDDSVRKPVRDPKDPNFLSQIADEYEMDLCDRQALYEHIDCMAMKTMGERLIKLINFCRDCGLPTPVVFSTLVCQDEMSMVQIAAKCGVSKQAIHKHFRKMEVQFAKYGPGYERRRQFKNPKGTDLNDDPTR